MVDPGDRLAALFGLRLKGFAEADAVAALTGVPVERCRSELSAGEADGLVLHRAGRMSGWMLTPAGRAEVAKLLAGELDASGARVSVERSYERFLEVNGAFLALCTDWQMKDEQTLNDHADPAYDGAVIARLGSLDDQVQPICADLGDALRRFGGYGRRLTNARQEIDQGQTDWFTKPMIDSYHTVWFELHEDLLATLSIERSQEAG
ncbi:MAG: MarR family transcriptional regulator [Actinomycetota bacterium]|nr:MarR family transcriptional regulator [Actinomycetota bacterium]